MGTLDPDAELTQWQRELISAIEMSCRSHYGPETALPTFPWYLDLAPTTEAREVLNRITVTTKRNPHAFSQETAAFLEKTVRELRDKQQFNLVNQVELNSVLRKAQEYVTPLPGRSKVTVKLHSERNLDLQSATSGSGSAPSVDLDINQMRVHSAGRELLLAVPKELLAEQSLERLCMDTIHCELSESEELLEMTFRLAQTDLLEVLRCKQLHLEQQKKTLETEINQKKDLVNGVMEALEIKDDPPHASEPKERYCDYCAIL